jgi:hypothetical protein
MADDKPYTTVPTTQTDLQAHLDREADGKPSPMALSYVAEDDGKARSFQVEGNEVDGFFGVNPEYMNYADDTHKPGTPDEGVEAEAEERLSEAAETEVVVSEETATATDPDEGGDGEQHGGDDATPANVTTDGEKVAEALANGGSDANGGNTSGDTTSEMDTP